MSWLAGAFVSSAVLSWVLVFTCGEAWLGVLSLAVYMADLTGFSLLRGETRQGQVPLVPPGLPENLRPPSCRGEGPRRLWWREAATVTTW